MLFGSGRPVIVYPEEREITAASSFPHVTVAWDGGAEAARAVADALPVLRSAAQVTIFVATGEKPSAHPGMTTALVRHLRMHGVEPVAYHEAAGSGGIGKALRRHVEAENPDLMVMGAFGQPRLAEFILGGATEAMLRAPPCPILMSH
jgi:nucleotide-binding universal stress UspA family protein